jgi:hypothetical protein
MLKLSAADRHGNFVIKKEEASIYVHIYAKGGGYHEKVVYH